MSVILLTPNLSGADGISTVARLVTRACEEVTVLALHEADRSTFDDVDVEGSGGRSSHFVTAAARWAVSADRPATVIVNHLHLAPAALAFAARGASLLTIVHGVEAWKPLTWLQRVALDRSERIVAVSAYSRDRFRAANPHFAQRRDRRVPPRPRADRDVPGAGRMGTFGAHRRPNGARRAIQRARPAPRHLA